MKINIWKRVLHLYEKLKYDYELHKRCILPLLVWLPGDYLGYLGLALSVVKAFTQLEPVWLLFNLAGTPARELCSFSSVYTQVCLYFCFFRT